MKTPYTCKNEECLHDFIVTYYGKDEWTDPEITPGECPKCNEEVDFEEVEGDCTPDPDDYLEIER